MRFQIFDRNNESTVSTSTINVDETVKADPIRSSSELVKFNNFKEKMFKCRFGSTGPHNKICYNQKHSKTNFIYSITKQA